VGSHNFTIVTAIQLKLCGQSVSEWRCFEFREFYVLCIYVLRLTFYLLNTTFEVIFVSFFTLGAKYVTVTLNRPRLHSFKCLPPQDNTVILVFTTLQFLPLIALLRKARLMYVLKFSRRINIVNSLSATVASIRKEIRCYKNVVTQTDRHDVTNSSLNLRINEPTKKSMNEWINQSVCLFIQSSTLPRPPQI
jgi:hypothetical protein